MTYSFKDCILFLTQKYPHTFASQWKCNSIFQDNNGENYQLFAYDKNLSVILWENTDKLIEVDSINDNHTDNDKYKITKDLDNILSKYELNHLFYTHIQIGDNVFQEDQFLQTLKNGINISTLEGAVTFSKKINFNDFTQKCAIHKFNLMQAYFDYMLDFFKIYEDVSPDFMESFIINQKNDESLLELLSLLLKIENGYVLNKIPIKLKKEKIYIMIVKLFNIRNIINIHFNDEDSNISIFNELVDLFLEELNKYSNQISDN